MINYTKERLRIRKKRRLLTESVVQLAGFACSKLLLNLAIFSNAKKIATYISNDGEIGTNVLNRAILDHKKLLYLPRIHKQHIYFQRYRSECRLRRNKFGIFEPISNFGDCICSNELDLVVVPLLGFDNCCNRLGMGGGYYDRALAASKRRLFRRPWLVGYGYDFQHLEPLVPRAHDVSLHAVVVADTTPVGRARLICP